MGTYTTNSSNELTAVNGVLYGYDNNGNTVTRTDSNGTTQYAWDFENRLTQVTLPNSGGTVSFKYDPFGRRIYKQSPSATSIFAYDGYSLAETVNAGGGALARYAQGIGIDEPLAELRGATTDFYELDGLGSVTSLTDNTGASTATYKFDSFGALMASTGSVTNAFRYASREFDSEINLYFYRARYYDPFGGRFLGEDPLMFDSGQSNFYSYVANSPVNNTDPFGLCYCILLMNGKKQTAYMLCFPSNGKSTLGFPVASGNNGEESNCKNNPECAANEGQGPIPPGSWRNTNRPNSKGNKGGRSWEPVPGTGTNESEGRTGILSHWCANPFGPSLNPPYCSEGCITASEPDIKSLNKLLDAEPGCMLQVIPVQ